MFAHFDGVIIAIEGGLPASASARFGFSRTVRTVRPQENMKLQLLSRRTAAEE